MRLKPKRRFKTTAKIFFVLFARDLLTEKPRVHLLWIIVFKMYAPQQMYTRINCCPVVYELPAHNGSTSPRSILETIT